MASEVHYPASRKHVNGVFFLVLVHSESGGLWP